MGNQKRFQRNKWLIGRRRDVFEESLYWGLSRRASEARGLSMSVLMASITRINKIDPEHRYGNNLHPYYKEWLKSSTNQDFLVWLNFGDGKEVDLEECPRSKLDQQCVKYLGPKEREYYEYVIVDGKILHNMTGTPLHHGSPHLKYIFVVSTAKKLYAGEKEKGIFHHSSFLAGGATLTAGRLFVEDGLLKRISPSSGHYKPTEDSFERFLSILKENGVNLDEVEIRKNNLNNGEVESNICNNSV
ncbi:IQ domain-containing protein IQM3-like [Olea europaea var. sylvestris]|uniref:IQ domain-containing protein IQM3-like n=1 Tax=Olea europaea var. sylvestris TaxID=158386 RepID=UPI000C1CD694|nr:IQ domain-containing protein IQM3-like [Olea europaea var. sylvestris]